MESNTLGFKHRISSTIQYGMWILQVLPMNVYAMIKLVDKHEFKKDEFT